MRRLALLTAALMMIGAPLAAHAQYGGGGGYGGGGMGGGGGGMGGRPGGGGGGDDQAQDAAKKKKDKEWSDSQAPLPELHNAGPCPFVKSLYDAARYVEFKDDREASANVAYSGEIQGISSGCKYNGADPIAVTMDILFELGKGPQAAGGGSKTYRYWVAVTDRNREVIAKQEFELPVNFNGKDRVFVTDSINNLVIPRGDATTSGANFEVLVGFEVTPQMAAFNREGKRFRVNAGAPTTVAAGTAAPRQ